MKENHLDGEITYRQRKKAESRGLGLQWIWNHSQGTLGAKAVEFTPNGMPVHGKLQNGLLFSHRQLSGLHVGVSFLTTNALFTGLLSETLCSLTLEAEAGDNVTIWCHDMADTGHVLWFKHTNDSVPLLLGCKQVTISGRTENCYFFSESERIVMSVHGKNTSLTITAVNVFDTGLYYCSFIEQVKIIFSNSTTLQVKDTNKALSKNSETAKGSVSSAVLFMLTVVFGAVIVILLAVLIFTILKHRKTYIGVSNEAQDNKDQESDSVNYAALQFSNKKTKRTRRRSEMEDTHIVYCSVR